MKISSSPGRVWPCCSGERFISSGSKPRKNVIKGEQKTAGLEKGEYEIMLYGETKHKHGFLVYICTPGRLPSCMTGSGGVAVAGAAVGGWDDAPFALFNETDVCSSWPAGFPLELAGGCPENSGES